jgi:hypothetical protein
LKGRHYKVEYEGLHLLCLACGRFDHYSNGCPNKSKPASGSEGSGSNTGGAVGGGEKKGEKEEGPWIVVKKQRKPRKAKEGQSQTQAGIAQQPPASDGIPGNMGSRFALLTTDNAPEIDPPEIIETSANDGVAKPMQLLSHIPRKEKSAEKSTNVHKKGSSTSSKGQKINATRVSFKEKKMTHRG